jgi:hypothetical protein
MTPNPIIPPAPKCTLKAGKHRVLLKVTGHHPSHGPGSVKPRTLKLTASCDQAVNAKLVGTVTSKPKGGKKKAKQFTIQTGAALDANEQFTFSVKVPKAALARGNHVSISFTLTATNDNGAATATAKIAKLRVVR